MSTEKPTPSELTALWILMTAKTWGAAIGAIAEGEPQVVEMLAAHDRDLRKQIEVKAMHVIKGCSIKRCPDCDELAAHDAEVANAAAKQALLDAANQTHEDDYEIKRWLRARAESYGGQ